LENPIKQIASQYYNLPIILITEYGTNCADTAIGSVNLSDSSNIIQKANVFTPNGDGLNDEYRLEGAIGQCAEGEIYIYNRWGQLVFESQSINFRWNGKDQIGNEMVEGVYYYLLKTKKKTEEQWKEAHGTVTLIK
jgi:gliding motility-associated-like protein